MISSVVRVVQQKKEDGNEKAEEIDENQLKELGQMCDNLTMKAQNKDLSKEEMADQLGSLVTKFTGEGEVQNILMDLLNRAKAGEQISQDDLMAMLPQLMKGMKSEEEVKLEKDHNQFADLLSSLGNEQGQVSAQDIEMLQQMISKEEKEDDLPGLE